MPRILALVVAVLAPALNRVAHTAEDLFRDRFELVPVQRVELIDDLGHTART